MKLLTIVKNLNWPCGCNGDVPCQFQIIWGVFTQKIVTCRFYSTYQKAVINCISAGKKTEGQNSPDNFTQCC